MTKDKYTVIAENITDTSQAPKGKYIYYKCFLCGDLISSRPTDNIGCSCGNIFIDVDYFRLSIKDYSKFQAVKKN